MRYLIAIVFIFSFYSCEKDITIDLPKNDSKLVIEGRIESGSAPFVILSNSVSFFDEINFETLEKSIQFCDQKYCSLFLNVIRDNFGDSQSFANKFVEAYIQYFPYNKVTKDPQVYDKFLFGFPDDVNYLRDIVRKNYNLFH